MSMALKPSKTPFIGNSNHAYNEGYIQSRMRDQSYENVKAIEKRAISKYMPEVTGATKKSSGLNQYALSRGGVGFYLDSLSYKENTKNPSNPYPATGRYGFRTSRNPYNVDKYEWYARAYSDKRKGILKKASEVYK